MLETYFRFVRKLNIFTLLVLSLAAGGSKAGENADGSRPAGPAVEPVAASTDIKPRRWGCMCMASIDDVAPVKEEEAAEAEGEEGEEADANEDPHAADVNDVKIDIGAESKPEAASKLPVAAEAPQPVAVAVTTGESLPAPTVVTSQPIASTESPARTQASEAAVTARPTLMAETPQKGAAAMPSENPITPPESEASPLSPAHEKANTAVKRAQAVLHAAATAAAMSKAAREARTTRQLVAPTTPEHEAEPEPEVAPQAVPTETEQQARPVRGALVQAATPLRTQAVTISEEDDDDDVFVLEPVVRPDLPDEWVAVTRDGETYYVNYARNQSNWSVPPGY
jgi:hypothetical protein